MLLFIFPMTVLAESVDPDYEVVASYINADIDVVGSMKVREAFVVKGSLNGYRRKLEFRNSSFADWEEGKVNFEESSFYNARGITLSKVSARSITKEEIDWTLLGGQYKSFEETTNAIKGDKEIYTKDVLTDGYNISIYNPNSDGYMVYYFEYYVNQVVGLHNDLAEIYYTFLKLDSDDVKEVNIQVTTPVECTREKFRFWAHAIKAIDANISGISTNKKDGEDLYKGVILKLNNYEMGDAIDIRLTFDKSIYKKFEDVLNNSKMDALDKIIEVEEKRAGETNSKRLFIKIVFYTTIAIGSLYLIGLVLLWIHIYRKYDKEYQVNFQAKYYREFTGDYNVEVVDYLMNKNISTNAMNASIMNLIYKKNISIEEIPNEKSKKSKSDIVLHLNNRDNINDSENKLLDLLFVTISKSGSVSLKEIEDFSSNYRTAEKFMSAYNRWHISVLNDAKNENFFEDLSSVKGVASLYFILGLVIIGVAALLRVEAIILMILIFVGALAFLIYILAFNKWTMKGREHYLKWNAFKNFLTDFGSLKDKEIPEIALWDKYLVYATLFGISAKVLKAMKVKLTEMGIDETNIGYRPYFYNNYYMFDSVSHCMSDSHTKATTAINVHNASSSMSSGSGFGGGISGGGGHAGGGGGGGGF